MYKHSRDLENDAVFGDQMKELVKLIGRIEDKFDTKIYIDSKVFNHKIWANLCVGLHGDKDVVNLVVIKFIVWQNKTINYYDPHLLVYPIKDLLDKEDCNAII